MKEFIGSLDWETLLQTILTVVLVPICKVLYEWLKAHKLENYGDILYSETKNAVKAVYQEVVVNIKGTSEWNDETKQKVKELAKVKSTEALSNIVYKSLKAANKDFDKLLDTYVETALFDLKNK